MAGDYWTMGKEAVAYGTAAATLTRAFEVQSDDHKANSEPMESRGMRAATVSQPVPSYTQVIRGATGSLPVDGRSKGMGFFIEGASGSYAVTTPGGATDARLHTGYPTTGGPLTSYTTKKHIVDTGGTTRVMQYEGGSVAELGIANDPKGFLKLTPKMIYKTVKDSTGDAITASTPSYPGGTLFTADNCTITLDGSSVCAKNVNLTLPTGLERRDLVGCVPQPKVKGRIDPSGVLAFDFADMTIYRAFITGDVMPLVITWTGALIEGSTYESFKVTCANIVFDPDANPEANLDDYPNQPAPFKMLTAADGTPPWKIEIVTTDTAV